MKIIFFFLISFIYYSSCSEALCGSFNKSSSISYQIHSFNDLREWNQLLNKGATWFKIDPHYMNYSFCLSQQNDIFHRSEGCFLLSHDLPINIRKNYNTTDDVLILLNSSSIQSYITQYNHIYIALCFKIDDFNPCDGSEKATNWTILVDELFSSYSLFLEQSGIHVEFILDGSGTAGGGRTCLQDKWKPWNYTWIIGDDPEEAFYLNTEIDAFNRFQIMNTPVPESSDSLSNLEEEASNNYGKFKNSDYPFLNWEPSDQKYIIDSADYYLDKGIIHDPGFRYAINIDPIQFEIFAGSRSGNTWNYCLSSMNGSTNSLINNIPNSFEYIFLISYYNNNTQHFSLLSSQYLFGSFNIFDFSLSISSSLPASDMSSIQISSSSFAVLLWYTNGSYTLLELDLTMQSLNIKNLQNTVWNNNVTYSSASFISYEQEYNIVITSNSNDCSVAVDLVTLDITSWTFIPIGISQCIGSLNKDIESINIATITINDDISICSSDNDYVGVITLSDSRKKIYSTIFCINSNGIVETNGNINKIDIGSNSKVSLNYQNNNIIVLEIHGDGYCWNNERDNKRADKALCDSIPISHPLVLNYNIGSLNQWNNHINNEIQMSPCDNNILHGVYDFGTIPYMSSYINHNNELSIIEIHSGVSTLDEIGSFDCGMSIAVENSFILDSWILPIIKE